MSTVMSKQNTVAWTEIPVSDMQRSIDFYNAVFEWDMTVMTMGAEDVAVLGGKDSGEISGNLVAGPVAAGKGPVIYIYVPDLRAATERARAAGAKIETGVVEIPPGRYTNIQDPDGNRIGLFEAAA